MKKMIRRLREQHNGFTLVELLVVVAIVVALATVSAVSVTQFAGKGDQGAQAAEKDNLQSAMDTMMADKGITAVTANNLATLSSGASDFATIPTEGPLAAYMRENPTAYYYCWDSTGLVTEQFTAVTACTQ